MPVYEYEQIPVTSPKKEVPVIVEPQGEVPNDMAIESVTLDHNLITIYASEATLAKINELVIWIILHHLFHLKNKTIIKQEIC